MSQNVVLFTYHTFSKHCPVVLSYFMKYRIAVHNFNRKMYYVLEITCNKGKSEYSLEDMQRKYPISEHSGKSVNKSQNKTLLIRNLHSVNP